MGDGQMTLAHYLTDRKRRRPHPAGDFLPLVSAVAAAVKVISNQAGRGALAGVLGSAGVENVQGEVQKRLDVISNDVLIAETQWTGLLGGLVSEEMADVHPVPAVGLPGRFLLLFDPLDGSSNIDINMSVGTIFSIVPSLEPGGGVAAEDFLRPGAEQVCAGFALYGPTTMLVLTMGDGVDGFTLDRDCGEFVLTHPGMRIPAGSREFAINASNQRHWEPPVQRYVEECLAGATGPRQADFNMRWVASLVADAFRILTRGGVFLYPKDARRDGRLRLLYECNPIGFIIEQAGGAASTGRGRILDIQPEELHQRVPFIFGTRDEVALIEAYHAEEEPGPVS